VQPVLVNYRGVNPQPEASGGSFEAPRVLQRKTQQDSSSVLQAQPAPDIKSAAEDDEDEQDDVAMDPLPRTLKQTSLPGSLHAHSVSAKTDGLVLASSNAAPLVSLNNAEMGDEEANGLEALVGTTLQHVEDASGQVKETMEASHELMEKAEQEQKKIANGDGPIHESTHAAPPVVSDGDDPEELESEGGAVASSSTPEENQVGSQTEQMHQPEGGAAAPAPAEAASPLIPIAHQPTSEASMGRASLVEPSSPAEIQPKHDYSDNDGSTLEVTEQTTERAEASQPEHYEWEGGEDEEQPEEEAQEASR